MAGSRERAREAVLSGRVLVSGSVAEKPARLVDDSEPIHVTGDLPRYVSRGGLKLEGALDAFVIDVSGMRCLDLGASTGGFTDCLLKAGASEVVAVDVGRGQLAWELRNHPSVKSMERTDVRDLDDLGEFGLVTVDLSFISLRTVMPAVSRLAGRAPVLALVKPQFEVGRARVGSGGVVRDRSLHDEAVRAVVEAAAATGLHHHGTKESVLPGAEGNLEYFVLLRRSGS